MSRFSMLLAGAVVAVAAVAVPAAPAFAHDSIVGSDPAPGDRLESPPEAVSLQFSGDLLQLGDASTIVIVADAQGHDWVESPPVVDGSTVTATLSDGMPAAGYEIRWQVVSQDGHPISGVVPFTVAGGPPLGDEGAEDEGSAAPEASVAPMPDSAPADTAPAANHQDQGATRVLLVGLVGAAVAAAAFALTIIIRRRRSADDSGPAAQ